VFQGEGDELPWGSRLLVHEVENSLRRSTLNQAAADWADALLTGFAAEEVPAGLEILGDPGVLPALAEASEPEWIGVDVR
jgi:hypothetical protein